MATQRTSKRSSDRSPGEMLGRDALLATLVELSERGPVVLVGPPGVGKTRLLEAWVAERRSAGTGRGDVVPFEGRSTADELASALVERLGIRARAATSTARIDALLTHLDAAPAQLALDAIDDVDAGAVALLRRIAATGTTLVASSRVVPPGEVLAVLEVPPLAIPAADGAEAARNSAAARLLVESARRVGALEVVDDETWAHAGRIARHFDGLPLALGVAAARMRAVGIARLADDLTRGGKSAPKAHATLTDTVATSLERLEPAVLAVLELAATFPDGFSLEELEALAGDDISTEIGVLISHSLVSARQTAAKATRLHYTTHAIVRLSVLSRCSPDRRRELDRRNAVLRGTTADALARRGPSAVQQIAALERSFREAFAWAIENAALPEARDTGAAIGAALGVLLEAHGPSEGLVEIVDAAGRWGDDPELPAARRAELAYYRGYARVEHIDLFAAQEHLSKARALAADGVHRRIEAGASIQLAWVAARYGDVKEADRLRDAIDVRAGEDPWLALMGTALDTLLAANVAKHEEARRMAEAWRTYAIGLGDGTHESYSWGVLGCIALDQGDAREALRHLDHSIALARRLDARICEGIFSGYRAIALHALGEPSLEAYADAIARSDRAGALLYSGLYRAWEAVLRIQRGEVDEGRRALDMLIAAASWEMPAMVLGMMRAHVDLAEAARARARGDEPERLRWLGAAARRLGSPTEAQRKQMIQVRLVQAVLRAAIHDALDAAPPSAGLAIRWEGGAIVRDGVSEELSTHPTLKRLVWELALARLAMPGTAVEVPALLAAGWPGERIDARGTLHRLRVAMSTLRRAGLGPALTHEGDGYLLDPQVPLTIFLPRDRR